MTAKHSPTVADLVPDAGPIVQRFPTDHPALNTPLVWLDASDADPRGGVSALFRRAFALEKPLSSHRLWVSASQRFELRLDGQFIAAGPSRSDEARWHVTPVKLPKLSPGPHVLAARVTHYGELSGVGQMGPEPFLLVAPDPRSPAAADVLATGRSWKGTVEPGRQFVTGACWKGRRPYYVVGAGEEISADATLEDWADVNFADDGWLGVSQLCHGQADEWGNLRHACHLRPDPLVQMARTPQRFRRGLARAGCTQEHLDAWLAGAGPLTLRPADAPDGQATVVLDVGTITNCYPRLRGEAAGPAQLHLVTSESPYVPEQDRAKFHRDRLDGAWFQGHGDRVSTGGGRFDFTPTWFRSFRYLELTAEGAGPVTLAPIELTETAFPLTRRATFRAVGQAGSPSLRTLWDVSWRTLQLCSHETFFDCPHYEQAQFPGDTRIQAIGHYVLAGQPQLARKAIDDFHASILPMGLTQCRYPSRRLQVLPTFSLYWIGMQADYLRYRNDAAFVAPYLPRARGVMEWFISRLRSDGLLGPVEYAPFMDWTSGFAKGNAPQDADGGSAILTLLLARAARWMERLELAAGQRECASRYRKLHRSLLRAVKDGCWHAHRKLLADTPTAATFSVHAQVEGVLAGFWSTRQARAVLSRAIADPSLTPPGSFYYRFYLLEAMRLAGLGDQFVGQLAPWQSCLQQTGLNTWPESQTQTPRSDCHAWGIAPAIGLMETVVGLTHDAPGTLSFAPHLGPLESFSATVPTAAGAAKVELAREGGAIGAELETPLPVTVAGTGQRLEPGQHRLSLA